jgi:hypothetical protein
MLEGLQEVNPDLVGPQGRLPFTNRKVPWFTPLEMAFGNCHYDCKWTDVAPTGDAAQAYSMRYGRDRERRIAEETSGVGQ